MLKRAGRCRTWHRKPSPTAWEAAASASGIDPSRWPERGRLANERPSAKRADGESGFEEKALIEELFCSCIDDWALSARARGDCGASMDRTEGTAGRFFLVLLYTFNRGYGDGSNLGNDLT